MRTGIKRDIERLKKMVEGMTITIRLEGGEKLTLKQEELLELVIESLNFAARRTLEESPELSETAEKVKQSIPGRDRTVDFIRNLLLGGGEYETH